MQHSLPSSSSSSSQVEEDEEGGERLGSPGQPRRTKSFPSSEREGGREAHRAVTSGGRGRRPNEREIERSCLSAVRPSGRSGGERIDVPSR